MLRDHIQQPTHKGFVVYTLLSAESTYKSFPNLKLLKYTSRHFSNTISLAITK